MALYVTFHLQFEPPPASGKIWHIRSTPEPRHSWMKQTGRNQFKRGDLAPRVLRLNVLWDLKETHTPICYRNEFTADSASGTTLIGNTCLLGTGLESLLKWATRFERHKKKFFFRWLHTICVKDSLEFLVRDWGHMVINGTPNLEDLTAMDNGIDGCFIDTCPCIAIRTVSENQGGIKWKLFGIK